MTLLTQDEVEARMRETGRERMLAMIKTAEEEGRASNAPYAQRIFREFVLPLAQAIRTELEAPTAGQGHAHIPLLAPLDPDAVAFLAVRHTLNACLASPQHHRGLGYSLGRTVHRELVLAQIEIENPELYHTLARDLARRMSTDERHRLTVFKMQAKKQGVHFEEWGIGARDQIGLWLLGRLVDLGMVEMSEPTRRANYKREYRDVILTPSVSATLEQVRGYMAETFPAFGPCVELPLDWHGLTGGGFHTRAMQRVHYDLVKCHRSARPLVRAQPMPTVLAAVNALQRTAWRINRPLLRAVREIAATGIQTEEIVTPVDRPKPDRLPWMDTVAKEDQTEEQSAELRVWKRAMSEWYEERKLRMGKYGRYYLAARQAEEFKDYPALYFVYFADSRGRLYPMTQGVNPQGSDLQRALLEFAEGLPLHGEALSWFLIHGANKYGFDKATADEREQWVRENDPLILAVADDPTSNLWWRDADKPMQFLAWALEYAAWRRSPADFVSRLPISMDGSCNGLQHFSAMLRDEVGGQATNLTPGEKQQDIYQLVADAAVKRLAKMEPTPMVMRWREHGIPRALTKRSVMTTPYGVTLHSARDYVIADYLSTGAGGFERTEWLEASRTIMDAIWPAIGDVVVKAREAMQWLRQAARLIVQSEAHTADPFIKWRTPSGFLATQAYFEPHIHRIRTLLHGPARIRVLAESDDPNLTKHASSFAPNFVHSMDAAHLHRCAARAAAEGIPALAMIHDDYGTHAAHAAQLARIIREEFVAMYEEFDPLEDLRSSYQFLPQLPQKGTLDIKDVLESRYFFL